MRNTLPALTACSALLFSSAAFAQTAGQYGGSYGGSYSPSVPARSSSSDNVGNEAQVVFGVDRVAGVFFDRQSVDSETTDSLGLKTSQTTTTTSTAFAVFGNQGSSPSTVPRLALDYFVVEGLSLGGSFVYFVKPVDVELESQGRTQTQSDTLRTIVVHPRVGYSYIFDDTFAIWPRAGITWTRSSTDDASTTAFDLSADVPIVISPFEHFALLLGPYLDLGVGGTQKVGDTEFDSTSTSFGLAFGLAGYY